MERATRELETRRQEAARIAGARAFPGSSRIRSAISAGRPRRCGRRPARSARGRASVRADAQGAAEASVGAARNAQAGRRGHGADGGVDPGNRPARRRGRRTLSIITVLAAQGAQDGIGDLVEVLPADRRDPRTDPLDRGADQPSGPQRHHRGGAGGRGGQGLRGRRRRGEGSVRTDGQGGGRDRRANRPRPGGAPPSRSRIGDMAGKIANGARFHAIDRAFGRPAGRGDARNRPEHHAWRPIAAIPQRRTSKP